MLMRYPAVRYRQRTREFNIMKQYDFVCFFFSSGISCHIPKVDWSLGETKGHSTASFLLTSSLFPLKHIPCIIFDTFSSFKENT